MASWGQEPELEFRNPELPYATAHCGFFVK